jgi:ferritin
MIKVKERLQKIYGISELLDDINDSFTYDFDHDDFGIAEGFTEEVDISDIINKVNYMKACTLLYIDIDDLK